MAYKYTLNNEDTVCRVRSIHIDTEEGRAVVEVVKINTTTYITSSVIVDVAGVDFDTMAITIPPTGATLYDTMNNIIWDYLLSIDPSYITGGNDPVTFEEVV